MFRSIVQMMSMSRGTSLLSLEAYRAEFYFRGNNACASFGISVQGTEMSQAEVGRDFWYVRLFLLGVNVCGWLISTLSYGSCPDKRLQLDN